jgi:hypothetical protein
MEEGVRLKIGNIMSKGLRVVKPSEMLKVELTPEQFEKLKEGASEIIVDCERRERK